MPENTEGRDFVIGDIHGCFYLVDEALHLAQFVPDKDRLIVVGDLVDRGPQSNQVVEFLARPYVYSVRGNHEDVIMNLLGSNDYFYDIDEGQKLGYLHTRSMAWIHNLDDSEALNVRQALEALPLVIEIDTPEGPIGFVHADVPNGMGWQDFTALVEAEDKTAINTGIWSRARAEHPEQGGVDGALRIFFGHTPFDQIQQRGNCFFVDTGAVFSDYSSPYKRPLNDPHLTFAQTNLKDHFYLAARSNADQGIINILKAVNGNDLLIKASHLEPNSSHTKTWDSFAPAA